MRYVIRGGKMSGPTEQSTTILAHINRKLVSCGTWSGSVWIVFGLHVRVIRCPLVHNDCQVSDGISSSFECQVV
ncbi:hypothetical protein CEXT_257221 [Caerostris extrusa]|uniref:Uncharacterized protein n=1 Tax=Caerostris extrusa TaxID=172846 RepID=A0AAV4Q649_CAEEX|nr:hypothetical protein CEXT_257221 [Caerostris extrusa]